MNFENFEIRPICIEDSSNYFLLVKKNEGRLTRYFPKTVKANNDLSSTIEHITERVYLTDKKEFFTFIILNNLLNQIVGTVFIRNLDWSIPKGELGYFIDKDYEGKGIITKAIALISKHCFESMGLNKITIRIADDNISSRRVAEKNNYKLEGILKNDYKTADGKLIDIMYYGLTPKHNQMM